MAVFDYHKDAKNDGTGEFKTGGYPYVGSKGGAPYVGAGGNLGDGGGYPYVSGNTASVANEFNYNRKNGGGFRLVLTELGYGHIADSTAVIGKKTGIGIADGILKVNKSYCTETDPYAFVKVTPYDETGHTISSWHWGLYSDASSTTDIWNGVFHGDTLTDCGSKIGLDTTDLVAGRELRMWAVENNEVAALVRVKIVC